MSIVPHSDLSCPHCGHVERVMMPMDACMYFYECKGCGRILKPERGDCCVFCSYGSVRCPPVQTGNECCKV